MKKMNMFYLTSTFILCLSFLVSCSPKNSGEKLTPKSCLENSCDELRSSLKLKLIFPGKILPENLMLIINGDVKIDECQDKASHFIYRYLETPEIQLHENSFMEKEIFHVEIFDLGTHCQEYSLFHDNKEESSQVVEGDSLILTL